MYQRIFVPVDGSDTADLALQEAIKVACDQHAQIRLGYVVEEVMPWTGEGFVDTAALEDDLAEYGKKVLAKAEEAVRNAGVAVETALLKAGGQRIAKVIIEEADRWPADLIVIGTHGRRGFDQLIFGSVAIGVIRMATHPILLIRGGK